MSIDRMQSARDVDAFFQRINLIFEGKETEHNWKQRDNALAELSKVAESHVPREFHHAFVAGIKTLLDALIICALSERTTLSNSGCQCLSALAKNLGTSIHSMLDYLLPAIIKLCASTKPISQRAADVVYKDIIVGSKTYHKSLLHHTASAFTSENASARIYAPGWLESLIKLYGPQVDHHGGSKQVEDSVKRSVNDANSKARENSRSLYWSFVKQWPTRAEAVMSSLEPQRQRALQDDIHNPNKPAKSEKFARPGSSLAEAKAQAKKALQLKRNVSSPEILPFAISTDKDKLEPKLPSTQNERKRPPTKLKHESAHQLSTSQSHALQPNPNPASSAVLHNRPESSHHSLHSKSGSTDSAKSQESQSAQRSRPLMAAPVRRAVRVVANSTPAPAPRPNSRDGHLPAREAKLPLRPQTADTPDNRKATRSPLSADVRKIETHARTRSKPEVRSESINEVLAPVRVPQQIDRPIEDHRRRPTQTKDVPPAQAAAKLQHAMKKIRAYDMAPLALTKLRRLIETNSDVLFTSSGPYNDVASTMLLAADNIAQLVAKHLQNQPEDAYASIHQNTRNVGRPSSAGEGLARDYRYAIISLLQSLLSINPVYFAPFYCSALLVLLRSRAYMDDADHKVKDLEDMSWNIIARSNPFDLLRHVLDLLDSLPITTTTTTDKISATGITRTTVMSLQVLGLLCAAAHNITSPAQQQPPLFPLMAEAASQASRCSRTANPRVRKASVDLAVTLQRILGEARFDEVFDADEGVKNMVVYYARKGTDGDADNETDANGDAASGQTLGLGLSGWTQGWGGGVEGAIGHVEIGSERR